MLIIPIKNSQFTAELFDRIYMRTIRGEHEMARAGTRFDFIFNCRIPFGKARLRFYGITEYTVPAQIGNEDVVPSRSDSCGVDMRAFLA